MERWSSRMHGLFSDCREAAGRRPVGTELGPMVTVDPTFLIVDEDLMRPLMRDGLVVVLGIRPADRLDRRAATIENPGHRPGPTSDHGKTQNVRSVGFGLLDGLIDGEVPAGGVEQCEFVFPRRARGGNQHARGHAFYGAVLIQSHYCPVKALVRVYNILF